MSVHSKQKFVASENDLVSVNLIEYDWNSNKNSLNENVQNCKDWFGALQIPTIIIIIIIPYLKCLHEVRDLQLLCFQGIWSFEKWVHHKT